MNPQNKPVVSVLLSTYNGHKFLRPLVDSVLAQEDVEVRLQVRDDGSSDDTIDILESYQDPRISIRRGENLGPAKSFLALLAACDDSPYYAYCDQDDVWYPRKLITAVEALRDQTGPALFLSTYDIVDENLNKFFTYDMRFERPLRLQETLIFRAPSACNMVFNHALRTVINRGKPQNLRMHDFWTLLTAEAHGYPILTCDEPLIMYRHHGGNTVGIKLPLGVRVKRWARSLIRGNNERWRQAKELYDIYGGEMAEDQLRALKLFVDYRKSFSARLALMRDKGCVTGVRYVDAFFKASVLMGKF